MMEPAKTVIEICGGLDEVARMCGRHRATVFKWARPKGRAGTGGFIPTSAAQDLLSHPEAKSLGLRAEHFFISEESD